MKHARTILPLFALFAIAITALPGCRGGGASRKPSTDGVPVVRVRLVANAQQVNLVATQPAVFRSAGESTPRRLELPAGTPVPVTLDDAGRWKVGNVVLAPGELHVQPEIDGTVEVNGTAYHGHYRLVPTGDGRFDLVNHVDIESYLQGVLPRELLRDFDLEAYKAQAVAARTYALWELQTQKSLNRHWDVWADTRSQVYGGIKAESGKANEAVEATRGVVAAWGEAGNEKIFKAYFSACCGGIGQASPDAFGENFIPPLADKNVGALCNISPRYNWPVVTVGKDELTRRMRGWGASRGHAIQRVGRVERVDVSHVNRFGRPVRYLVTDASGQQYVLGGEETRWAINFDRGNQPQVFSSFFKPVNQASEISFAEGRGFGHGVGLCQWCAQAMALQGVPAEEIVRRSYPTAVLVRAY